MSKIITRRLLSKSKSVGIWSVLAAPTVSEVIGSSDFDWVLFDCEHGPNQPYNLMAQLNAVKANGINTLCFVRTGDNDIIEIKRILDLGVDGIMIPMISSAKEAELVVNFCTYPPQGLRGTAGICRASKYGKRKNYLETAKEEVFIIIQVETIDGIKNLESILRVDGIDAVFIGPSDLAASMGYTGKMDSPEVTDVIDSALSKILKSEKIAGTIALDENSALSLFNKGFQFVAVAHDAHLISTCLDQTIKAYRN